MAIFGECLNYKSGLRILIWPLEVPFFLVRKWALLGPILAKFQFCWFSGLFWAFFPSKKCKNENLSPHFNFWSITLKFFLWTHTTQEHVWLQGCSSIKKKVKNGTPYWILMTLAKYIKMMILITMTFHLFYQLTIEARRVNTDWTTWIDK